MQAAEGLYWLGGPDISKSLSMQEAQFRVCEEPKCRFSCICQSFSIERHEIFR